MNAKIAAEIIKEILYITIATSRNDMPWNTPVYSAFESDLDFYWSSHPESQHSQNIAANANVFLVIYNSKAKAGEGVGVYVKGKASQVTTDEETSKALGLLAGRKGKAQTKKTVADIDPQRVYKVVPEKVWVNDATRGADGRFIQDFRVEVAIDELKE